MDSPEMAEIVAIVGRVQGGDRAEGRTALLALWDRYARDGTPMQRCVIAHFLADGEENVGAELEWDLAALEAATGSRMAEDNAVLDPDLAGFLPSLHLNAGDACRRMGDMDRALRHATHGLAHARLLPPGGYGDLMRSGLERLRERAATSQRAGGAAGTIL